MKKPRNVVGRLGKKSSFSKYVGRIEVELIARNNVTHSTVREPAAMRR